MFKVSYLTFVHIVGVYLTGPGTISQCLCLIKVVASCCRILKVVVYINFPACDCDDCILEMSTKFRETFPIFGEEHSTIAPFFWLKKPTILHFHTK